MKPEINDHKAPSSVDELFEQSDTTATTVQELRDAIEGFQNDPEFVAGLLTGQVVNDIYRALKETKISQSELARRSGKSKQAISRILLEKENLTLETVAAISCALGWKPLLHILPQDEWIELSSTLAAIHKDKRVSQSTDVKEHIEAHLTTRIEHFISCSRGVFTEITGPTGKRKTTRVSSSIPPGKLYLINQTTNQSGEQLLMEGGYGYISTTK